LSVADVAHVIKGETVPAYDALGQKIDGILNRGQQTSEANQKLINDYRNLQGTIQDQSSAYQAAVQAEWRLGRGEQGARHRDGRHRRQRRLVYEGDRRQGEG
jgi:hypothetical protein